MDSSTTAAIVALIIALLALFVACAQAIQQYFQTGSLIRLCDSVVYGPMPGQGHRVWKASQFRFRIVYSVPQISLESDIWPAYQPFVGSTAFGKHPLAEVDFKLSRPYSTSSTGLPVDNEMGRPSARLEPDVGEATWVSFCRVAQKSCGVSIRYDLVQSDADRCPTDLPNVPMQVSLRDVIVMAIFSGMSYTYMDFESRSLSMQGSAGSISSSQHPILGPLLRFTPRIDSEDRLNPSMPFGARVNPEWVLRTLDYCKVAGDADFFLRRRRIVQRTEGVWRNHTKNSSRRAEQSDSFDAIGKSGDLGDDPDPIVGTRAEPRQEVTAKLDSGVLEEASKQGNEPRHTVGRSHHDGDWQIDLHLYAKAPASVKLPEARSENLSPHQRAGTELRYRRTATHDAPGSTAQAKVQLLIEDHVDPVFALRSRMAKRRQKQRQERTKQIYEDQNVVNELVRKELIAPLDGRLLLTYPSAGDDADPAKRDPTAEELEAEKRERERAQQRKQRDKDREARGIARARYIELGPIDWYWISQMDVCQGPWATPWHKDLHLNTCRGGIAVFIEALLEFFGPNGVTFTASRQSPTQVNSSFRKTGRWMCKGVSTWPSYAWNSRGGVIPDGTMFLIDMPCFETKVPILELLYSYDWQCNDIYQDITIHGDDRNVELMRLDAWLSYVGRLPEIVDGRSRLLRQTPAFVKKLMEEFEVDFLNIEESATEGGMQDILSLAANVYDFMMDEQLSEAEQVFVLVACLRTMKVARCINDGPDTHPLQPILTKDAQVYLI